MNPETIVYQTIKQTIYNSGYTNLPVFIKPNKYINDGIFVALEIGPFKQYKTNSGDSDALIIEVGVDVLEKTLKDNKNTDNVTLQKIAFLIYDLENSINQYDYKTFLTNYIIQKIVGVSIDTIWDDFENTQGYKVSLRFFVNKK